MRRTLINLLSVLPFVSPVDAGSPEAPPVPVPEALAENESMMRDYTEVIRYSSATIEMVPIRGGTFVMGSPESEEGREEHEGPQHTVAIEPFWMGKYEITWDAFEIWMFDMDVQRRKIGKIEADPRELRAEEFQTSQPTKPYTDMTFGMGRRNFPAISMTQFAARIFCKWLSEKTGRYYRLPTEAEWEYACRAGTRMEYSFRDDVDALEDYAWFYDNADESYHKVGKKNPNPWGLYDMHGNVSEWTLDQYRPEFYADCSANRITNNPLAIPTQEYPRIVRGGSWDDDPELLRSAARGLSSPDWKRQDPQLPKSIWYHTDAQHVGFRILRPLRAPSEQEERDKWDKESPVHDRKSEN